MAFRPAVFLHVIVWGFLGAQRSFCVDSSLLGPGKNSTAVIYRQIKVRAKGKYQTQTQQAHAFLWSNTSGVALQKASPIDGSLEGDDIERQQNKAPLYTGSQGCHVKWFKHKLGMNDSRSITQPKGHLEPWVRAEKKYGQMKCPLEYAQWSCETLPFATVFHSCHRIPRRARPLQLIDFQFVNCDIERLQIYKFLENIRNTDVLFYGDSLMSLAYTDLVCRIHQTLHPSEYELEYQKSPSQICDGSLSNATFVSREHNISLAFISGSKFKSLAEFESKFQYFEEAVAHYLDYNGVVVVNSGLHQHDRDLLRVVGETYAQAATEMKDKALQMGKQLLFVWAETMPQSFPSPGGFYLKSEAKEILKVMLEQTNVVVQKVWENHRMDKTSCVRISSRERRVMNWKNSVTNPIMDAYSIPIIGLYSLFSEMPPSLRPGDLFAPKLDCTHICVDQYSGGALLMSTAVSDMVAKIVKSQ